MTTFFTADTHFGHANIIKLCDRPFTSIDDMDYTIIESWNSVVRPNDVVWHLGDFAFTRIEHYLAQLKGNINLIVGNHDDKVSRMQRFPFASVQEVKYIKVEGQKIYLSHYAHRTWRSSHHGSWHLYGHSHGSIPEVDGCWCRLLGLYSGVVRETCNTSRRKDHHRPPPEETPM